MAEAGHEHDRPSRFSGEEARQGRIVLTTRRRRTIFFGGLIILVLFPLIVALIWH